MYEKSKLPEFSPAVVVEPWRKALMDAAEYIRVHGWWHGCDKADANSQCASNAIGTVTGEGYHEAHRRLELYLGASKSGKPSRIFEWNDAPERTAEDVIRALEECARS